MAEHVWLAEDSDRLILFGAPESGADLGDWVEYHAKTASLDASWMLRFQRPQEYFNHIEERDEPPEEPLQQIDVDVELLDTAPAGEPGQQFMKVVELSVAVPAEVEGSGPAVAITATSPDPYRVRLMVDESRFPTRLSVQSWPAPVKPGRVLRGLGNRPPTPPHPASLLPEVPAAVAAAARIGNDVDAGPAARHLSGQVDVVRADIVLPRSPAWHSDWFERATVRTANPDRTMPFYGQTNWNQTDPAPGGAERPWLTCVMRHQLQVDRITGWRGGIWSQPHPDDDPRRRRMHWWRWVHRTPPPPEDAVWDQGTWLGPMLPRDTLLIVQLNRQPGTPVHTRIVIEHRDVPVEWVDDLTDWWALQLAIHSLAK